MEEIDLNSWIIEPEIPLLSHTSRRIAIGNHSSISIDIDPKNPNSIPDCKFLGSDLIINPIKEKLNKNIINWDFEKSVLENFQNLLDFEFPKKKINLDFEEYSIECGICYSYKLENYLPDKVCNNIKVI
jgi:E3 ubiquitin-protein ligase FANCL